MIWTRLLSLLFGATVYTFSLILAVFLIGLGIGSSVGSALSRDASAAARGARLVPAAAVRGDRVDGVRRSAQSLPYWPINPSTRRDAVVRASGSICVRCLWAVLPAAILWGASFPLALAAVGARDRIPARLVGGVYAANTVGAIVGALVASLLLVAVDRHRSTRSRC